MSSKAEKALQGKVADLTNQLKQLKMSKAKPARGGRGRGRGRGRGIPRPYSSGASSREGDGLFTVTRSSVLATVTARKAGIYGMAKLSAKDSSSTVLPWLHNIWTIFQRYKWVSLRVYFKPSVSANTDGRIAFGFSGATTQLSTRQKVLSLTPVYDCQIWQDTEQKPLSVPADLLHPKPWMDQDDTVGSIQWFVSGPDQQEVGELWISYKIQFINPTPS